MSHKIKIVKIHKRKMSHKYISIRLKTYWTKNILVPNMLLILFGFFFPNNEQNREIVSK